MELALRAVVEEMADALRVQGASTDAGELGDNVTAVFDAEGALVSQSRCRPLHVGVLRSATRTMLDTVGDVSAGDVIMTNDPYLGGASRLPDFVMLSPAHSAGTRVGYVATMARYSDVGAASENELGAGPVDVYAEGLRIPPVSLLRGGKLSRNLERLVEVNVRDPGLAVSELHAQLGAVRVGQDRLAALAAEVGPDKLREVTSEVIARSESLARSRVATLSDGVASFVERLDGVELEVLVEIDGSSITVDLTRMPAQLATAVNGSATSTYSVALAAVRTLIGDDVPVDEGSARVLTVKSTPGSVVRASVPAATTAQRHLHDRVWDALLGALDQLVPERTRRGASKTAGLYQDPRASSTEQVSTNQGSA